MKNIQILLLALLIIFISCSDENTSPATPQLKEGEIKFQGNTLYVPNSTIISEGKTYSNQATLPEGKLVGIQHNGKTYIFFTGLKDSTFILDFDVSIKSVASFIVYQINDSLKSKVSKNNQNTEILSYQWELPTGIGITQLNNDQYQFSNFKVRWAAVDNGMDEPKFLFPKNTLSTNIIEWCKGQGIDAKDSEVLNYRNDNFRTYGSVIKAMALPQYNLSFLIDKKNLQKAFEEDPILFSKLNALEFLHLLIDGIREILSLAPDLGCVDATLVNSIAGSIKTIGTGLLIGEETARKTFENETNNFFNDALICILTSAGSLVSGPAAAVAEEFWSIFTTLMWVGDAIIIGSYDAATSKYYAEFTPDIKPIEYGTVTDIDGNVYKTVKIGNQIWMAENLNVSRYRNGDLIRHAASVEDWKDARKKKEGAWSYYNNDPEFGAIYGKLYNGFAIEDPRGLAPQGLIIPKSRDFGELLSFLGGSDSGGKLKESGTTYWASPNTGATNESGFSGLPGGLRLESGSFKGVKYGGYWWSSTVYIGEGRYYLNLSYEYSAPTAIFASSEIGFSVRCIKD